VQTKESLLKKKIEEEEAWRGQGVIEETEVRDRENTGETATRPEAR
jgi:hypothetical protein